MTLTVTPPAGLAPPVTETTVVGSNRVSNPGGVGAGGGSTTSDDITELKITAPTLYSGQVAPCSNQSTCTFYSATNSAVTPKSVTLQATTASTAQRVVFAVDGQVMATAMGPATTFTWTWSLPDNQPDGDYIVTAQIYNSTGTTAVSSPSPLIVTVNRYVPDQTAFAPTSAGRNPLWSGVPEVETYPTGGTSARVDRDITGFLASRLVDGSLDGFACQTYSPVVRNCQDVAAPACCDSAVTYRITPTGANPDGSQQVSGITTGSPNVNATNTRPNAPTALVLSRIGSSVTLSWTNPSGSGDPDSGDCIDYFRIYRKAGGDNGAWSYADRVDRTTFGNGVAPCGADATEKSSSLTLLENDSTAKQYRVTAVDTHLAESTMVAVGG